MDFGLLGFADSRFSWSLRDGFEFGVASFGAGSLRDSSGTQSFTEGPQRYTELPSLEAGQEGYATR